MFPAPPSSMLDLRERPDKGEAMKTRRSVALIFAVAATAMIRPAMADSPPPRLTSLESHARWSGSLTAGVVLDPAACTPITCQSRTVEVALPPGAFAGRPAGMLVAVRWPDDQLDYLYDLDLYVYGPNGELAASSTDFQYSTAEAAWIQDPPNGEYRVVVAARWQAGVSPFEVVVYFEPGRKTRQASTLAGALRSADQLVVMGSAAAESSRPVLPDLAPAPVRDFHMETTAAFSFYNAINRGLRHPPSCYPQETAGLNADSPGTDTPHPLRCLRFNWSLLNLGEGPFEIRAYPNNGEGTDAWQIVYNGDGTNAAHKVGQAQFSSAHGHTHFRGFEETALYTIGADGRPQTLVRAMAEKGRCAMDNHIVRFGEPGTAPMRYTFPGTCDQNWNQDPADPVYPNALYFRSGLSAGWIDEYPWFLLDQYIDVTGVPDGRYLIVSRVNDARTVIESNHDNNTAVACVELRGDTAMACASSLTLLRP